MTEQNNPGSAPQEPQQPPAAPQAPAPQAPAAPQIPQQSFGDAPATPPAAPGTGTFGSAPEAAPGGESFGAAPGATPGAPPPPPGAPLAAGEAFGAAPAEAPKKKSSVLKIVSIVAVIVVAICIAGAAFLIRSVLNSDDTKEAKAGDCIGNLPDVAEGEDKEANSASVIACTDPNALYKVEGRLEDKTEEEAKAQTVCDDFPNADSWYRAIPDGGKGYVLCLSSLKQ